ncbi:MAG: hypothetical protein ACJAZ1_002003 [Yoonia sp.]|jgi:hypothetical protein
MGQGDPFCAHLNAHIRNFIDIFSDEAACQIVDFQLDPFAVSFELHILVDI